uniref:Uncharacterized protein n=1 Tax=Anguilla anguilla TaxID=7936 RepID=A0A0E9S2Y4_ANGAN
MTRGTPITRRWRHPWFAKIEVTREDKIRVPARDLWLVLGLS